jgi:transposase
LRARLSGRDRKTVRKYLAAPKPAREPQPSCLEPFRDYLTARLADDAHVDGTVLYREVAGLGLERSYVTFVRELRRLSLRPRCEACRTGGHGVTLELSHEAGEEIQFDWLELSETPWGEPAYVLVGALCFSGRLRAVIGEGMTFAHLAEAIDGVLRRLGGTTRAWRTDRMATVVCPGSDRITAQFAQLAKHYGVEVWVCPPRRPQRKGVVEAAIKYVTRSWWQSAPVASLGQAQADLDRWSVAVSDRRKRRGATIGEFAAGEGLLGLPAAAFPAQLAVERVVSRTALVTFEGNRYSVSPGLAGQTVTVRACSGELALEIVSQAGRRVARHRRAPAGAGQLLRTPEHARALEQAVLDAFTTEGPCRGPRMAARRIGQLVGEEVACGELTPPMAADPVRRLASESPGQVRPARVDRPNGKTLARLADWEAKVAVVRDHDGGVDAALEGVEQKVGGDVDVRGLLFTTGMGDDEGGVRDVRIARVPHHDRPVGSSQDRSTLSVLRRKGCPLDPRDVVAVLDRVDVTAVCQRMEVGVLVGVPGRVLLGIDSGGAVDDSGDGGRPPRGRGQAGGKGPQVEPAPPRSSFAAHAARAVVKVEPVDVDTHVHLVGIMAALPASSELLRAVAVRGALRQAPATVGRRGGARATGPC